MNNYIPKSGDTEQGFETIDGLVDRGEGGDLEQETGGDEPAPEIFDRNRALEQVGGDPAFLAEIAQLFLEDGPKRLEAIREGLSGNDADAIYAASHALKGGLATLGALRASDAAHRLETIGRDGDLDRAEEAMAALIAEVERLKKELAEIVAGRG